MSSLPVARRFEGFPFPPSVNILIVFVPKHCVTDESQLFDESFILSKSFETNQNVNGDGLLRMWYFLVKEFKKRDGHESPAGSHPHIIRSMKDWSRCNRWYPIAFERVDSYTVVIEHPMYPVGLSAKHL